MKDTDIVYAYLVEFFISSQIEIVRKMNFFKEHLNWTWALAVAVPFLSIVEPSGIAYIVAGILRLLVFLWILNQKERSWAWIFISICIPFLDNHNKQTKEGE